MKTTFIAFLAAAFAVATAQAVTPVYTYTETFTTTTTQNKTLNMDLSGDDLVLSKDSWTLQFTISDFNPEGTYPTVVTFSAGDNNYAFLWSNQTNDGIRWGLAGNGNMNSENEGATYYNISTDEPHVFTLTATGGTSIDFYIDGKKVTTGTYSFRGAYANRQLQVLDFGSKGDDSRKRAATFSDIAFYKGAYTPAELAASDAVPEPTTATLSLLALAGLAARRRRK